MNLINYLLTSLAEEASEVAHASSKCIKFTLEDTYTGISNQEKLEIEISQLFLLVTMLNEKGVKLVLRPDVMKVKREAVLKYYQHSINVGTVLSNKDKMNLVIIKEHLEPSSELYKTMENAIKCLN